LVRGSHSSVHEEVAARKEGALGPHQQGPDRAHFVGCAAATGRAQLDHPAVARSARPAELVARQRGENDSRADGVDPRAALAPADRLGHDPQRVAALGELVGVEGILYLVGLQERQRQQLVRRRQCKRLVLLHGQGSEPVTRL
jgi:hypothetical protein